MANNTTPPGYYDRYDRKTKDWKKVLFRPGYPLQAAELNEIQSMLQSDTQQLGLALFSEGGLLSGCSAVVNTDKTAITISPGQVYALGFTHDVPGIVDLPITGVGTETLGLLITSKVVDEVEDPDLLDPVVGSEAFGYPGAHRLTYEYEYALNDPTAIRLVVLQDGQIDQTFNQLRPTLQSTLELLAKRTYEQSGHYTVEKFKISVHDLDLDDSNYHQDLQLQVQDGLAYVKGWRVENETQSLVLKRPVTSFPRLDEPEVFVDGTLLYTADNAPIRKVDAITATVESVAIAVIRGGVVDGMDEIPVEYQPVVAIQAITTGAPPPGGTPFVEGTDFVPNGNYVDWSPAGAEPAPGETYYLVVHYVKQMVKGIRTSTETTQMVIKTLGTGGTDALLYSDIHTVSSITYGSASYEEGTHFTVDYVAGAIVWLAGSQPNQGVAYEVVYSYWANTVPGDFLGRSSFVDEAGTILYEDTPILTATGLAVDYKKQISFDTGGDLPVAGTLFYQKYEFSLPRQDLLVVNPQGYLQLIEGTPALEPVLPSMAYSQMRVARLSLPAEARAADVVIELADNQRLTMINLRTMLGEIKDIQYNQAVSELDTEAAGMSLPTEKRGIFSDLFNTFDKADLGSVDFAATIDVLSRNVLLPQVEETLALNSAFPTTNNVFVPTFSHTISAQQIYATETIQANPYTFVSMAARLDIDPQEDRWEEQTVVTVQGPDTLVTLEPRVIRNRVFLRQFGRNGQRTRIGTEFQTRDGRNRVVPRQEWLDASRAGTRTIEVGSRMEQVSNSLERVSSSIEISVLPNARQIEITVEGSGFLPDETNIQARFNGTKVPLTPTGTTVEGDKGGTVLADSEGTFTATLMVPANTPSGAQDIVCSGTTVTGGAGSRAMATFFSEGLAAKTTNVVSFTRTQREVRTLETQTAAWTPPPPPAFMVDPVAQTFVTAIPIMLTQVEIFFKSKASDPSAHIELLIVSTVNAFPSPTILGEARLLPAQIAVSDDASVGTIFSLNQPVYLEADVEYAFIVRTNVPDYIFHIARVGALDPVNGWVDENPYTGVMLTSANMQTWSAEQNADIKFTMRRARYDITEDIIDYGAMTFAHAINRFELSVTTIIPSEDCTVLWQYSKDNSLWVDFVPPVEVAIGSATDVLYFRAKISGTEYLMPLVRDDGFVVGYYWETAGSYLARQFQLQDQDCRYVNLWADVDIPTNTTITAQVNFDDGNGWQDMAHVPADDRQISLEYTEQHWTYDTGSDFDLKQKVQVRLNMTSTSNFSTPKAARLRVVASTI